VRHNNDDIGLDTDNYYNNHSDKVVCKPFAETSKDLYCEVRNTSLLHDSICASLFFSQSTSVLFSASIKCILSSVRI